MSVSSSKINKTIDLLLKYYQNRPKNHFINSSYLVCHNVAKDENEANDILKVIQSLGLITVGVDFPEHGNIEPLEAIYSYKYHEKEKKKISWSENVKMPFIVSLLTYLLLDGIKWLLPHLLKWISSVLS